MITEFNLFEGQENIVRVPHLDVYIGRRWNDDMIMFTRGLQNNLKSKLLNRKIKFETIPYREVIDRITDISVDADVRVDRADKNKYVIEQLKILFYTKKRNYGNFIHSIKQDQDVTIITNQKFTEEDPYGEEDWDDTNESENNFINYRLKDFFNFEIFTNSHGDYHGLSFQGIRHYNLLRNDMIKKLRKFFLNKYIIHDNKKENLFDGIVTDISIGLESDTNKILTYFVMKGKVVFIDPDEIIKVRQPKIIISKEDPYGEEDWDDTNESFEGKKVIVLSEYIKQFMKEEDRDKTPILNVNLDSYNVDKFRFYKSLLSEIKDNRTKFYDNDIEEREVKYYPKISGINYYRILDGEYGLYFSRMGKWNNYAGGTGILISIKNGKIEIYDEEIKINPNINKHPEVDPYGEEDWDEEN